MGVTRYCLSYSFFYEQLKLHYLTYLTEGVVSITGNILDRVDQRNLLIISRENSCIKRKPRHKNRILKNKLEILISFLSCKAKLYRFHRKL